MTRTQRFSNLLRGFGRTGAVALTAAVAAVPLLAAAPAHAGGKECFSIAVSTGGFAFGYHDDGCCRPSPNAWAAREYERGVQAGHSDGFNNGYRDGLRGDRFCADPRIDFCRLSRPFQDGYRSDYGCEYREGFEKGRSERQCQRDRDCCRGHAWGAWWRR
jgi:hypothetical protein